MLRKGAIFLILTSMMLHCAARMNFLSYVYEHRMEIAFSLGFINEVPIAMCHDSYEFDKGLKIVTHDSEKSTLPLRILQVQEIILFFQSSVVLPDLRPTSFASNYLTIVDCGDYVAPAGPIFHPPA